MSLLSRLLISVTVMVLCVLVGVLALSLGSARAYLNEQLGQQADNAATSLSLLLSQQGQDTPAARELLMSALFDTAQFRSVRFLDVQGQEVFVRRMPTVSQSTVPFWFSRLLPLEAAVASREVSSGWQQQGAVIVEVDDSFARDTLWRSSTRLFGFVLLAGLAWSLFAIVLVRRFRRSLAAEVSAQLQAITQKTDTLQPSKGPVLRELRDVGTLFSTARERVMATESELESRIESLTLALNEDPVTGLPNRKYFINELRKSLMATRTTKVSVGSYLFIARVRDLAALSTRVGHKALDAWLHTVGKSLGESVAALAGDTLAGRLNGSDFAILLPATEGPEATRVVQQVRQALLTLAPPCPQMSPRWAFALVDYAPDATLVDVLSRLDYSLMRAESAGHDEVEYLTQENGRPESLLGGGEWRSAISSALVSRTFSLQVHETLYSDGDTFRLYEGNLQMPVPGQPNAFLEAQLFLPAAVRLGLSGACDLQAISLGLRWLYENSGSLVIRLSLPSLITAAFREELGELLQVESTAELRARLILEINAFGLVNQAAEVKELARQLSALGVGLGLRRFGRHPNALALLSQLPLTYLKLDATVAEAKGVDDPVARFLAAVIRSASEHKIRLLASPVADGSLADSLRSRRVLVQTHSGEAV